MLIKLLFGKIVKHVHSLLILRLFSFFVGILKELIAKCKDGVTVLELCEFGDSRLNEETSKVFKKDKEMKKGELFFFTVANCLLFQFVRADLKLLFSFKTGVAFPTCVSLNNCICHFSPLKSDPPVVIKDGDVVKM